jgi:hypothetical protein
MIKSGCHILKLSFFYISEVHDDDLPQKINIWVSCFINFVFKTDPRKQVTWCMIRRSGRPVYGTPRPIQRQQNSRFAGTKPLDLHVQLLQLQGRLICEFKFQMASLFDY